MSKYVVNIIGGLGNQLFQYALGYSLARKHSGELFLDLTGFEHYKVRNFELDNFNIKYQIAPNELTDKLKVKKIFNKTHIKEKCLNFNKNILRLNRDVYLNGYWQTEKYFDKYKDEIRSMYTFKNFDFVKNNELLNEIKSTNSISVHVRLCDYVNNPEYAKIFFVCKQKYYKNAIEYMKKHVENPRFYVFSDDINGAKEFLPESENLIYCNTENWQEDLYYAQSTKHNIIANSSFAWWAAYLNSNENKIVIAPKHWYTREAKRKYKDIIPASWVKIDNFD